MYVICIYSLYMYMPSTLRGKIEHWIKSYTYLIHIVPVLCGWYAQNKKSILMHKSHWLSDILWRFTHSVLLSVRILWSSNCTPFRSTRVDVRFLTCGLCCSISWVLCVVLCRSLLVFLPFFLVAIVLSVLLWITYSDYLFSIFKLFLMFVHTAPSNLYFYASLGLFCLFVFWCF